jgi:hypothetical protein
MQFETITKTTGYVGVNPRLTTELANPIYGALQKVKIAWTPNKNQRFLANLQFWAADRY